jgi:DtxR family Mn-dependent transcriptional regulator
MGFEINDLSETRFPSSSVGDYLIAVWKLAEDSGGAASTKDVAARHSVSPASASNMFARLQEMGLVKYERYRGATLTERGRKEALRLVRRHRLIETFLLEHLGYDWQEVHDEAEPLETPFRTGSPGVWRSCWGIRITTRIETPFPRQKALWRLTIPLR